MQNAKISVIMPTYNMAHMIKRAIDSILNQSFQDFEIIVVNDGSTDNTESLIKNLASGDPRIKLLNQTHSGKPAVATNTGIKNSNGKYIAILDSDDEWLPTKLEKQLKLIESRPGLGFVACHTVLLYPEHSKEQLLPRPKSLVEALLIKCYLYPSSMLAKREALDAIGLIDENYWVSCDWGMFMEMAKKYDYDFVDEVLYKYYIHKTNHSYQKNYAQRVHDREYFLHNNADLYKNYPKLLEYQYITLASDLMSKGESRKARYYFKKSLELNRSLKNIARLAISYCGKTLYQKYRTNRGHIV